MLLASYTTLLDEHRSHIDSLSTSFTLIHLPYLRTIILDISTFYIAISRPCHSNFYHVLPLNLCQISLSKSEKLGISRPSRLYINSLLATIMPPKGKDKKSKQADAPDSVDFTRR